MKTTYQAATKVIVIIVVPLSFLVSCASSSLDQSPVSFAEKAINSEVLSVEDAFNTEGDAYPLTVGATATVILDDNDAILKHRDNEHGSGYFEKFSVTIAKPGEYSITSSFVMPITMSRTKNIVFPKLYLREGESGKIIESDGKIYEGGLGAQILKGNIKTKHAKIDGVFAAGTYYGIVAADNTMQPIDVALPVCTEFGCAGDVIIMLKPAPVGKTKLKVQKQKNKTT